MQYRAGFAGKPEWVFPEQLSHPKGIFHYRVLAQGAQLSFVSGDYHYDLYEPLKGDASIWVSKGEVTKTKPTINCRTWTDTLTLTSTINRFKALGINDD
jgi:hypothetical protein